MTQSQKLFLEKVRDVFGLSRISCTSNKLLNFLQNSPDNIFALPKRDVCNILYLGAKYCLHLKNEMGRLKATRIRLLSDYNVRLHIESSKIPDGTFEERKSIAITTNDSLKSTHRKLTKLEVAIEQINESVWGVENLLRRLEVIIKTWE